MKNVVIAGYVRSPFAFAERGALAKVRPDDLAAQVVRGLVEKTGVKPEDIEDLILGCAFPEGEQGLNAARLVVLAAELPISVAGATVNRFCGSSMYAIHMAAGAIRMDAGEAFVCAGVESMTRIPMGGFNPMPNPSLYASYPAAYISMGETAENVATRYQIPRDAQDAFAADSQGKAARAMAAGRLEAEIVPISDGGARVDNRRLPAPGHDGRGSGRSQSRLRRERHRHRGHVVAAHRRRRGGAGVQRGLCRTGRPGTARPDQKHRRRRV